MLIFLNPNFNFFNYHVNSLFQFTHLALPQMVARGRGVIVNVSSLSDISPVPLANVYAASKVIDLKNIFKQIIIN